MNKLRGPMNSIGMSFTLLYIVFVGNSQAGVFEGTITRLDPPTEAAPNVSVRAVEILANGTDGRTIFAKQPSDEFGKYRIDVGATQIVRLVFQDGRRITTLDRLAGTNTIKNLDVGVPKSDASSPCEPYFCPPRRRVFRWRCASIDDPSKSSNPLVVKKTLLVNHRAEMIVPLKKRSALTEGSVMRDWVRHDGAKQVKATLVRVEGDRAVFRRENGVRATAKIAQLSAADRQWIYEWSRRQSVVSQREVRAKEPREAHSAIPIRTAQW